MKLKQHGINMNEVETSGVHVLFSYETPVAGYVAGHGFLRTSKKWSPTTTRHINKWLKIHGATKADERPQEYFDNLVCESGGGFAK